MTLSLSKISHLLTSPHTEKKEFVEDEICPISRNSFVQDAKKCIEHEHTRPFVIVYVVDKKNLASFYQAEHYMRYVSICN